MRPSSSSPYCSAGIVEGGKGGSERKSHLCIPSSSETGGKDPAAFSSVSMSAEVLTGIRLRKSDGE